MYEAEKAVVQLYYDELNGPTEDIDPMFLFTEDVHHEIRGSTPISGTRDGTEAMAAYWASLRDNYTTMKTVVHDMAALEDGRIFVRSQSSCEPRGEGRPYDQASVYVFTVTGDKLSTIVKTYEDTASMIEQWN
jgi:ketosteroid isomerase-like protein